MGRAHTWAAAVLIGLLATTSLATPAEAAAAPKALKATATTATTITLDWASVAKAPQYRVQFSTSSKMSSPTSVRFTGSAGTLTGLSPAKKYWFRVRVISKSGSANLSTYTKSPYPSATTRAVAQPAGLSITSRVSGSVGLAWVASEGAVAYDLQRATTKDMASPVTSRTVSNDITVKGLAAETGYWFRVRAVPAAGAATSYTAPVLATTTAPGVPSPGVGDVDVRVGSFNIFGIDADSTASGNRKVWKTRKPFVARDILAEKADVVGLQEANQSTSYYPANSGLSQYLDLRNQVNAGGARYALANDKNYNCKRYISSEDCTHVDQGASAGVRILYNSATLAMQGQGSFKYTAQTGKVDRYLAWATFRVKANGRTFLFVTTHLQPFSAQAQVAARKAQWGELVSWVRKKRDALGMPVVVAGDFNSTKNTDYAETLLPAMKTAGFGDVLDQRYRQNPITEPRALTTTNAWVYSHNDWLTDLRAKATGGEPWSFFDARDKTGNNLDWIFATNALTVKEWKVVVDVDPATLKVRTTLPSDHNMVRATLVLPPPS
ncbi:MAG: endonuclease/exonuclease/phosphatase family protein [Marmoricola sp.]